MAGFPLKEKNWAGSVVQSATTASPSSSRGRAGRSAPPVGRSVGPVAGIADNLVVADLVVAVFDIVCILMFDLVVKGAIVDVVCETVLIDAFVDVMNEVSVKEVVGDEVLMGVTELTDVGLLFVLLVLAVVAVIVSIPAVVPLPGRVGGRTPVGLLSISVRLPPVTFPGSDSGLAAPGPATVGVAAGLLLGFSVGLVLEVIDGSVSERMNAGISSSEPSDDGLSLVIGFIGCSIIVASPVDSDIIFRIVDSVVVFIVIVSVMVSFVLVTFSEVSWPFSPTRSFPADS